MSKYWPRASTYSSRFSILKKEMISSFFGAVRSAAIARKSSTTQGRYEVFEDICRKTGAFVKPPAYTEQVCGSNRSDIKAGKNIVDSQIGYLYMGGAGTSLLCKKHHSKASCKVQQQCLQ